MPLAAIPDRRRLVVYLSGVELVAARKAATADGARSVSDWARRTLLAASRRPKAKP